MRARETGGGKALILGSFLTLSTAIIGPSAFGATADSHPAKAHAKASSTSSNSHTAHVRHAVWHGMSCVPFARTASGIDLPGNAREWWDNAVGIYARGNVPQVSAVLAFRPNPRMRLGHVAVVTHVINPREVEVDQANWGPGGRISRGVAVVDVSEDNDWTAVRVELGDRGEFGAVYPSFGFIYNRADTGKLMAASTPPVPTPDLNPALRDLRPPAERDNEVAELPDPAPAPSHAHAHHTKMHHVKRAGSG